MMNCWHLSWQKWGARKLTDFKVGDKVKIVGYITGFTGETGEITKTGRASIWPYMVTLPNGKSTPASAGELELVKPEPEPKFKVGDWVKVQGRTDKWNGTVGTVQKVRYPYYSKEHPLYTIHKNDVGDDKKRDISENVLQFFEDQLVATDAPTKFKKGDWVKITGWGGSWEGQVLQIDSLPKPGSIYYHLAGGGGFSDKHLKAAEDPATVKPAADMVNGPSHYGGADNPYEAIKVAEAWGFEKNAYLFNALKYLARAEHKGRKVEDLKKLQFYVAREIALEEAK